MTADVPTLGSTEWQDLDAKKLLLFTAAATLLENRWVCGATPMTI